MLVYFAWSEELGVLFIVLSSGFALLMARNKHRIRGFFLVIPVLGSILSLLESRWGYLCVIILPILIAFLYEIYSIVRELKGNNK